MFHGNKGRSIVKISSFAFIYSVLLVSNSAHASCYNMKTQGEAVSCLENKIEVLSEQLVEEKAKKPIVPKGAIVAFDATACPKGWFEYAPAYGRFLRGIDSSLGGIDPDGKRRPSSLQNDQFAVVRSRMIT